MTAHSQQRTALHQLPDKAARSARRWAVLAIAALLSAHSNSALAQTAAPSETTEQKVQQLTAAVARTQSQMDSYQKQLQELQRQLSELQEQLAAEKANPPAPSAPAGKPAVSASSNAPTGVSTSASTSAIEDIRERQAVQESQIATHEQTKVETASKYPLKVSGLLLFNGYVNTRQVDVSADPTYALPGGGSTGLSLRQTVLGLDARGPHLFGATSHADARVDFFASGGQDRKSTRLNSSHSS